MSTRAKMSTASQALALASLVALTLAAAPRSADAKTSFLVTRGHARARLINGKQAQIGRLRSHVTKMMGTLDSNPQALSKDVIRSLRAKLQSFERAGIKAIEAGDGMLTLWTPRQDVPQYGCKLELGSGASRRQLRVAVASTGDSTARTEAVRASGRATLEHNQVVAESIWFRGGGRRRQQTSLWTYATYRGGRVTREIYPPKQPNKGGGKAAKPTFGTTFEETPKAFASSYFMQQRDTSGTLMPHKRVLQKDSVSKQGLVGSWKSAEDAVDAATKAIDAIVKRGAGAKVSWRSFDKRLSSAVSAIHRAADAVRDGTEIFRDKKAPTRMAPLVREAKDVLATLNRATRRVVPVANAVHDKLSFIAAAELSTLLGDTTAPSPNAGGQITQPVVDALRAATQALNDAREKIENGQRLLSERLQPLPYRL